MADKAYKCKDCGKEKIVKDTNSAPDCCGHEMQQIPMDLCGKAHSAETARFNQPDDACDDGVR
ncbi:MAG TPA: hypothetical protein P5313_09275 [Spirochaetia bacterium]|nr:hypothetical protein [Spirochaetales bacterium]HRY80596.1 hypothetical protein [Spirochaetia bacterium]